MSGLCRLMHIAMLIPPQVQKVINRPQAAAEPRRDERTLYPAGRGLRNMNWRAN